MSSGPVVACVCGRRFRAPEHLAGKRVKCPGCGQPIEVPAAAESPLDLALLEVQSLPPANPLLGSGGLPASVKARPGVGVPKGVWIAAGVGGGVVLLIIALLIGSRVVERQRRYAVGRAKVEQMFKQRAADEDAKPTVVRSHTEWTIEFPGLPKTVFVNPREPGALDSWQTSRTIGNFSQGQGEQYLTIEYSRSEAGLDNDLQVAARINAVINVTAGVDNGSGRILSTVEISEPGYRGREVTYESTTPSGVRVSGRYRVLATQRHLISIEWISAPAKPEPPEVQRFFDSFTLKIKT